MAAVINMLTRATITFPTPCSSMDPSLAQPAKSTDERDDVAQSTESSVEQRPERSIRLKTTVMNGGKRCDTAMGPINWLLETFQSEDTASLAATKPSNERVNGTMTNKPAARRKVFMTSELERSAYARCQCI